MTVALSPPADARSARFAPLVIEPVLTKAQMRRFLGVPFPIHAGDACWVPPLFVERMRALSARSNPFLRDVEVRFWTARRGEEDVGRIKGAR